MKQRFAIVTTALILAAVALAAGTANAATTSAASASTTHWNCAGLAHPTAAQAAHHAVKLTKQARHDRAVARHLSRVYDPPDDGGICDSWYAPGDEGWTWCVWYYYYGGGGGGGGGC